MLSVRRQGDAVWIGLERADARNALDPALVAALHAAIGQAPLDGARALVLHSGVPGVFSIGMDLRAARRPAQSGSHEVAQALQAYGDLLARLQDTPILTVALVEGLAVGGGVDLAAACDLCVAGADAAFSIAQLRNGVFPLTTSTVVVPRIGKPEFLLWALGGQYWPAERAHARGLVDMLLPAAGAAAALQDWLARLERYDAAMLGEGVRLLRATAGRDPHALEAAHAALVRTVHHLRGEEGDDAGGA